jgi:tRNA-splicing ligase RtcB
MKELSEKVKVWEPEGFPFEQGVLSQVYNVAKLSITRAVRLMPDGHQGIGGPVGAVVATESAIVPALVGVDIGCGMNAQPLELWAKDLPDDLKAVREAIEDRVPVGFDKFDSVPSFNAEKWGILHERYKRIDDKHRLGGGLPIHQLGTLGGGNHFIEVCLDLDQRVWVMLHSGSRGIGNKIGSHFIALARKDPWLEEMPDGNLAYFKEGSEHFNAYCEAVAWAQEYAFLNRQCMMKAVLEAISAALKRSVTYRLEHQAISCHHNYVQKETHGGKELWITRKGAVRARDGDLGIIPGSMGARSFIVRGKGSPESLQSCSHGAGRLMSRGEAKRRITVGDHARATEGVECRKDASVLDESPAAYKPIDKVMEAQADLVEVLHELRQVVCVKG